MRKSVPQVKNTLVDRARAVLCSLREFEKSTAVRELFPARLAARPLTNCTQRMYFEFAIIVQFDRPHLGSLEMEKAAVCEWM